MSSSSSPPDNPGCNSAELQNSFSSGLNGTSSSSGSSGMDDDSYASPGGSQSNSSSSQASSPLTSSSFSSRSSSSGSSIGPVDDHLNSCMLLSAVCMYQQLPHPKPSLT
ncbi:unnamed protein product [Linum trigynum]|uniref:Uncharacterized protein n=1 Tax=Linum trigynum TaxID=586398 RepID=A0AAV2CGJ0_9ROSI